MAASMRKIGFRRFLQILDKDLRFSVKNSTTWVAPRKNCDYSRDVPILGVFGCWNIQTRHQYTYRGRLFRGKLDTESKCKHFAASLFPNERALVLAELQGLQDHIHRTDKCATEPPSKAQLRLVLLSNGIPFIGFGFLDNAIMIVAGDYIDLTIGVTLGISTMAAAALGNLVSDLAGVGLAGYVESLASRVGVHPKELTPEQADMRKTRWIAGIGRALGLTIGCLLGMFPLLFLGTREEVEESPTEGAAAVTGDQSKIQV
ncbi:transmembrane protein 65-like [Patiria miniata]|uniref:Transmembrane protein 65 n=1 Tax=Patiria miniata TaxID=46514 RepID=A0A914A1Z3_PATMI|nr:transmembrane protein 65-like [Patiria miniata]